MTATPIGWRAAPWTTRATFAVAALWARARVHYRLGAARRAARVRRATSLLLELAGIAAAVWGLWQLAPWLGAIGAGIALFTAGFLIEPAREVEE